MDNFLYHIPTKIYFGRGVIHELAKELQVYGSRVLLVYGGGSIKKSGMYENMIRLFQSADIEYWELSGVAPNPEIQSVQDGVKLCREHGIQMILAVGGGSVIDCGKVIAACAEAKEDAWDIVSGKKEIGIVLPVLTILTIAATGSEMDASAVISNPVTHEKTSCSHPAMRPVVSFMDPEYTYSVPPYQTAAGTADIISHVLESYFNNNPGAYLQNRLCEAILKTVFHYGIRACENPADYEARANLLWAGSWAINGLLAKGNPVDWSVHAIEHELSAYYGITHGAGLAVLIPHWLRHMLREENLHNYVELGVNVFGIDSKLESGRIAKLAVDYMTQYFKQMNLPATLTELGIDDSNFDIMAEKAGASLGDAFVPMKKEDVLEIYKKAL